MKKTVLFVSITLLVLGVCAQVSWEQPVHQLATATAASSARSAPLEPPPAAVPSRPTLRHADPEDLFLRSSVALVLDEEEKVVLYGRNTEEQRPIASLTKLMTAMVCLDAGLPLDEEIRIVRADRDRLRGSGSRLSFGTILSRYDTLSIALAASENRAAHALARTYPGGKKAFVEAMNAKARQLGMEHTQFHDSSGLNSGNVSTARDLVKLVEAAGGYELIREMTTEAKGSVTDLRSGWKVEFLNTNRLVRKKDWKIGLSKTGYIADAGNCLVMKTEISDRPVIIVLLNSWGKLSKYGDSNRIRKWLLQAEETARLQHPDSARQRS
jgi:D-alanyl-D-alanine endopeptidase (penicillin-binding protein 7)